MDYYIMQKDLMGRTDADKHILDYLSCKKFIENAETSIEGKKKIMKMLERETLYDIRQDELKVRLKPPCSGHAVESDLKEPPHSGKWQRHK